jgi:hypothetical protein
VENKVCNECGGLCESCRSRLLEKVTEIAGLMVAEAVNISVAHASKNSEGKKKREHKR